MGGDVVALVSVCTAALVSIISQLQQSRCVKINACCIQCTRDISQIDPQNDKKD